MPVGIGKLRLELPIILANCILHRVPLLLALIRRCNFILRLLGRILFHRRFGALIGIPCVCEGVSLSHR